MLKYSQCSEIPKSKIVDKDDKRISIKRQTELLGINRTSVYREPSNKVISLEELQLRAKIDRIHTDNPTWGYRAITSFINNYSTNKINRKRVRRIMRDMGIYAIYPKPNLSKRYHAQYKRPYLLRNFSITKENQVWGVDITYIPMAKGFMYLFVIIDWYSRYIVDYELSSTLDKSFVLACLGRALKHQRPDIINSDYTEEKTMPKFLTSFCSY